MIGSTLALTPSPEARDKTRPNIRPLVLVIEDDYRSSIALSMIIEDWGYACIAARCSREAVQTLGARLMKVSAIVTDYQINGQMSGIKDAGAIVAAIGRPIPIAVTTGFGDLADEAGTFPVFRKPFDPELLHDWLEYRLKFRAPQWL